MKLGLQSYNTPKKADFSKTANLYSQNKRDLGFLPAFFVAVIFVCAVLLGFWFVKSAGFTKSLSLENQVKSSSLSDLIDKTDYKEEQIKTQIQDVTKVASSDLAKIYLDSKQVCNLALGTSDDLQSKVKTHKDGAGWWLVKGECGDQNLLGVEIVKLTFEEYENFKNSLGEQNLQLLDPQNNFYAAVYTKNQTQTIYNFKTYKKYLVEPVFKEIVYLRPEDIIDTKHMGTHTYYLEGGCKSDDTRACNLWRTNNFSGLIEMLASGIAQTGIGEPNELKNDQLVKFAKNQDIQNALNLIIVNWKNQYPQYKLVTLDDNQWNIIQSFTVYPAQNMYFDYFR
jgi:hypothetical protein